MPHKGKKIIVHFSNNIKVECKYHEQLEWFLDEVKLNSYDAADRRIFSVYFQYQWPLDQLYKGYQIVG